MSEHGLAAARAKMREAGIEETAIRVFSHYYAQLESGATGMVPEETIEPVTDLPHLADLTVSEDEAARALDATVMIRLNGGLGTSMGMSRAKSLLPVRDGETFLDLIVRQTLHLRKVTGARLPLLLMNSFRTREDTLAALAAHPELPVEGLPLDFVQNAEPKLLADTLEPAKWPADPSLEWCPPGHGDIYTTLHGTGLLQRLLEAGYRYAFAANGDNLGATPDPRIAAWFAATGAPYAAEVVPRTPADRKGGHLARRRSDGRLILRETAQTTETDMAYFTDESVHPYAHANNLWFDLRALEAVLTEREGVLGLPLIRNSKTVDPADPASPRVFQIETALGAAVGSFPGATALVVGRDRFVPVKTTNDLLVLRSDAYTIGEDAVPRLAAEKAPLVTLDSDHYRTIDAFEERFGGGVPSLAAAESLTVHGDWTFGEGVTALGAARLDHPGTPRTLTHTTITEHGPTDTDAPTDTQQEQR